MINERRRSFLLASISVAASLTVAFIIISLSYLTAIDNTYLRLQEVAQSQARLIESMIAHERIETLDQGPTANVLTAVKAAHRSNTGFGETGEFALVSLEGSQIKFHAQQRVLLTSPATIRAGDTELAEPMKRALAGESGTILTRDYRGEIVLAAIETIAGSNLGLVAKIDRREIINRFVSAAISSVGVAIIVSIVSVFLFVRLGDPIIQRLRAQKRAFKRSIRNQKRIAGALRFREEQQRAIAKLGVDLLQGISLEDLFTRTVSIAAALLGVEFAKILELRPETDDLLMRAGVGWQNGLVGNAAVPAVGDSQAAFTLRSKIPVVVRDKDEECRFAGPAILTQHGIHSGVSVVIGSTDNPWGVLGIHAKECRDFAEADVSFVQSLANLLNDAIKRFAGDAELRKWSTLFRHGGWGMTVTDSSTGHFIGVNPAFAKMHGYSVDEALAVSQESYLVPGDDSAIAMSVGEVGEKDGVTYEAMRIRKDGSVFPAIINEVAVHDDQGNEEYRVANIQDSSEQKRVEKDRLAVERKVQHAQKLESLGVLAGGIAHDFNNILMTILGNASVALQDLGPEALARTSVDAIEVAARRAAGLSNQMLAYSGKGKFAVEDLAINNLVDEMAHLLEVSVAQNVVLKYSLGSNLPSMRGDASQIGQILMNLIINASDAIGTKNGVIQLTTGVMECDSDYLNSVTPESYAGIDSPLPEGNYNYLLVSDTGCGMHSGTVSKIFDPFFTTKFAGRGLGLAAMLGIVRAHRGAVKIYSEVGKGSSFKVLLPATSSDVKDGEAEGPVTATQSRWRGSGLVLMVDDDESIITLGKRMLDRLGYTPLTACDGVQAVDKYREHKDELVCVVLDLTMPRMDGAEAFSQIRRINPDARIILCSGYDEQQVTQEFAGRGLAGFLHKPYTVSELKKKIREVLG